MLAYVALTVCPPCAPGHVDHTEQSGRPAGREREHNAAAERLTDSDRTRAVGIRPSRDDLERTVEIIGLNLEAAGQIGILAKAVASNPAAIVIAPAQFAALGKPIGVRLRNLVAFRD